MPNSSKPNNKNKKGASTNVSTNNNIECNADYTFFTARPTQGEPIVGCWPFSFVGAVKESTFVTQSESKKKTEIR